jgi:hypothetical protein
MPVPFLRRYKDKKVKININKPIIDRENEIDTSLMPNIPSLKVFTT